MQIAGKIAGIGPETAFPDQQIGKVKNIAVIGEGGKIEIRHCVSCRAAGSARMILFPCEDIEACTTGQCIIACTADQDIITITAVERVISRPAPEYITSPSAEERVVAAITVDPIIGRIAGQCLAAVIPFDNLWRRCGLQQGGVEQAAGVRGVHHAVGVGCRNCDGVDKIEGQAAGAECHGAKQLVQLAIVNGPAIQRRDRQSG